MHEKEKKHPRCNRRCRELQGGCGSGEEGHDDRVASGHKFGSSQLRELGRLKENTQKHRMMITEDVSRRTSEIYLVLVVVSLYFIHL